MGEIADMMLDGTLCEGCGTYMGNQVGYPRKCDSCSGHPKRKKKSGHSTRNKVNGVRRYVKKLFHNMMDSDVEELCILYAKERGVYTEEMSKRQAMLYCQSIFPQFASWIREKSKHKEDQ